MHCLLFVARMGVSLANIYCRLKTTDFMCNGEFRYENVKTLGIDRTPVVVPDRILKSDELEIILYLPSERRFYLIDTWRSKFRRYLICTLREYNT